MIPAKEDKLVISNNDDEFDDEFDKDNSHLLEKKPFYEVGCKIFDIKKIYR